MKILAEVPGLMLTLFIVVSEEDADDDATSSFLVDDAAAADGGDESLHLRAEAADEKEAVE